LGPCPVSPPGCIPGYGVRGLRGVCWVSHAEHWGQLGGLCSLVEEVTARVALRTPEDCQAEKPGVEVGSVLRPPWAGDERVGLIWGSKISQTPQPPGRPLEAM
jgi:hypothetical protein